MAIQPLSPSLPLYLSPELMPGSASERACGRQQMEIACRLKYSRNGGGMLSDRATPAFSWRSAAKRAWKRLTRGRRKLAARLARRIRWVSLQVRRRVFRGASASGYQEVVSDDHQPMRYDMSSYVKNFDDGEWQQEEEEYYSSRSFASRFGRAVDESPI